MRDPDPMPRELSRPLALFVWSLLRMDGADVEAESEVEWESSRNATQVGNQPV
jgi:hypothetical protein